MNPHSGDIVRILVKVGGVDLRGQLAVVSHQFDRHGVRWMVLVPWLESWPGDDVTLRPDAVEIVASS